MEAARQKYGSRDYRNATGVMRDVLVASVNESYEDELARLDVPVTLLWGEEDREVPLDVATRASALLDARRTRLQSLRGVGHLVPTEAPDELANVVGALRLVHVALDVLFVVALSCAYVAQLLRWMRVLQREHYEASAMARFVGRWSSPQVATIPKSKVHVAQFDVAVLTAPRDDFQGAHALRAGPAPTKARTRQRVARSP